MDYNLIWVLTAVGICSCYTNERNHPEEYQGYLAHPIEEYRRPKSIAKPAYLHGYGNIITGNTYRVTKAYVKLSFYCIQKFWSEGNQEQFYFLFLDSPLSETLDSGNHAAEINQSPQEAAPDQINVRENVDIPILAQTLTRDRGDAKGKNHPHEKQ